MKTVRELHDEAMRIANLALIARQQGNFNKARILAREASDYESQAADLVPSVASSEPTRSILYRSAGSLAYQCGDFATAQRLIAKGLSGFPPLELAKELEGLYQQVRFEKHLQESQVVMEDEDLQLSLQGEAVGVGMILYQEFLNRIGQVNSLLDRTMQRLMGRTYQRQGRTAQMYQPFIPALAIPPQRSFAITIKLLRREQQQLPLFFNAAQIIDEVLVGVDLINQANEAVLERQIGDESYYRQFVTMARGMAPDGERISFVGLVGRRQSVSLTRHQSDIPAPVKSAPTQAEVDRKPIRVKGDLDFATRRGTELIGLRTVDGSTYDILILEGLDDLVRSYWNQPVEVIGTYDDTYIYPTDILPLA